MPEILHEQQGLKIVKNDKNRFCVVTLHYTADPAKRSPEWKAEASAGMHPARFAQEYEIDYTALFGEKVFPEISAGKEKIVVRSPYPEFPDTLPCWGGFDYGGRNPSSFHVYLVHDGVIYSVWELFEPCNKGVAEFAKKMLECPYWGRIKYVAADPSIWYNTQQVKNGLTSIYQLFVENGVTKLIRGGTDEAAWIAMMREHWRNLDDPTFRIFDCCANQIREFEMATYVSSSERLLQTHNYREAINDKDNHTLDDCKYFMNSRPRLSTPNLRIPNMAKRWLK